MAEAPDAEMADVPDAKAPDVPDSKATEVPDAKATDVPDAKMLGVKSEVQRLFLVYKKEFYAKLRDKAPDILAANKVTVVDG